MWPIVHLPNSKLISVFCPQHGIRPSGEKKEYCDCPEAIVMVVEEAQRAVALMENF